MFQALRLQLLILVLVLISSVTFAQAPVANFSANVLSGCSPVITQFTDLSTNNPTVWFWNLGNGTTSTLQNPSTVYFAPGVYTITLTATNANGSNVSVKTNYISVTPSPSIAFSAIDSSVGCDTKTVQFINSSTTNVVGPATYYWDFGDGFVSSQMAPTHTYSSPGVYSVSLVVTNSVGCSKSLTKTAFIVVSSKPQAAFTISNNASCTTPLTPIFTNTSIGSVSYQWFFGDGGTSALANPTHTYTATGSYNVMLIATSALGCKDTLVSNGAVNIGNLNANFSLSTINTCTGNNVIFSNTTTPGAGNSTWYFGDGNSTVAANANHSYTVPGTYTVKLVVAYNNCSDSATKTITVAPGPTTAFGASPVSGCSTPFATTFTNNSTGAISYLWNFGDGNTSSSPNPTHSYTSYGNFSVKLIATSANGCTDTLTYPSYITVTQTPCSISSTAPGGCAPLTIGLSLQCGSAIGISTHSWDFGDGNTGTGANPSHTYSTPGTYKVKISYLTSQGCTGLDSLILVVSPRPTASFTASPTVLCPGVPASFTNASTGATSYTWYFGDGSSSTAINPTHSYVDSGNYTVRLIASNGFCSDTVTFNNLILVHPPNVRFTASYNCANRKLYTFINQSSGAMQYSWNFGDGSPLSTAVNPTHTFASTGTYTVTLTATNTTYNCTNIYQQTVDIFDFPTTFSANDTAFCLGELSTYSTVQLPNVLYTYIYGTGQTSTTASALVNNTCVYPGVFTVKLIMTDAQGCKDSITRVNYIRVGHPYPFFTASPRSGCPTLPVNFSDTSITFGVYPIISRQWTFGDGTSSTVGTSSTTHNYGPGSFNVKLVVTDANGCMDSLTKLSYINVASPVAQFNASDTITCINGTVQFINTSTIPASPGSFRWDFGDGNVSTALNPSHTYSTGGLFSVKLVVTDANGCKDSITRPSYINVSNLHASFSMSDSIANCPPLAVVFTNTSTGATNYLWSFGNGSFSTQTNPTSIYNAPGIYTAKLIATSGSGCKDSTTKTITISGGPVGTLSYTPISGCTPLNVVFTVNGSNTSSYTWDLDNGNTIITALPSLTYTYTQSGIFVPKVVLSSGVNCNTVLVGLDSVKVIRTIAAFRANPNPVCAGLPVQFTDSTTTSYGTITQRSWTFGDGGSSNLTNPSHLYTTGGTYTVRLISTSSNGCKDTTFRTVVINPNPVISAPNANICAGASVSLTASGASTYNWSPATGLSCVNCPNPIATPPLTTTYTVTGTSILGCVGSAQTTVTVNQRPVVFAGAPQSICNGGSVQLQASGAATYVWSPATGLSCTPCPSPTASPTATTTYNVIGTNAAGCRDSAQVTVSVGSRPVVTASANIGVCIGSSTTLQASGAVNYSWAPATGLSCTNCSNPVATPLTTTTYTVTGTAANGCTNTAQVTVSVNPLPTVSAGAPIAICSGDSTILQASGAVSYTWSPAIGLSCINCSNPVAKPISTTTYTVTGTNANGCTNTGIVTVTVNTLPNVSGGLNRAICRGSSTQLLGVGATSFLWSPATGLSCTTCPSPSANPTLTTTYTVTGTNAAGCKANAQVTVLVNDLPNVTSGSNVGICVGGSTTLQSFGGNTYTWSPSTGLSCTACPSPIAAPTATTTYVVTGTDSNGCVDTGRVTVTVNPLPNVSAGNAVSICPGDSAILQATGAVNYIWSPATGLSCTSCSNPVAKPVTTTTYTVTGTNANGCVKTSTVTVTVNAVPTVSGGANRAICRGSSTQLQGSGAVSYVWSPSTGLSCIACPSPTANPTVTTTYTVIGTNGSGCKSSAQVTISVNDIPNVTSSSNVAICMGSTTNLQAFGGSSYTWAPATGLSCIACPNPTATPMATTTYIVTGTDANGCVDTAQVTVTVNPLPAITIAGSLAICTGATTNLVASGAASYVWYPGGGLSCTTCPNPVANPASTTTYTIIGTSALGCKDSITRTVTVSPIPVINAGNPQTVCSGTPAQLQASGASSYTWSPVAGLSCTACPNPVATPSSSTTYIVTGTSNGCSDTASVKVTILPLPPVNAGPDVNVCNGSSTQLTATGALSYVWSPAAGLSCTTCPNPMALPNTPTVYTVTGTGANGCIGTDMVAVNFFTPPVISAVGGGILCKGDSIQLTASGGFIYQWTPGATLSCTNCANPFASPTTTTTYKVLGTDVNGCKDSASVTVTVIQPMPVNVGEGGEICKGESYQLSAEGGISYTWTPAGSLNSTTIPNPIATPTVTTTYSVTILQNSGCFPATKTITVTVRPVPEVEAGPDLKTVAGTPVQILATGRDVDTYAWTPPSGLSCTNCSNPMAMPDGTTIYTVIGTNKYGCSDTDQVTIRITCDNNQIWAPNTFTPNADGENDRFYPHAKGISVISRFRIYDRWGELVFDRTNMPANDKMAGWDGIFKGQYLKPDVYIYFINALCTSGEPIEIRGDISLVR